MKIVEVFSNRRIRNYTIVSVLFAVLVITVYIQFFSAPPSNEGCLRYVECKECEHKAVKKIKDITDPNEKATHCEKCSKQVGFVFKCEDCDREFPVVPLDRPKPEDFAKMRTMGKFQFALEINKCPNCGSVRTHPMSIPEE